MRLIKKHITKLDIILALVIISSNLVASAAGLAIPGVVNSYIRVDSGWNKLNNTNVPFDKAGSKRVRANMHQTFGGGVGLVLDNNLRLDLTYQRHISPVFKANNMGNKYIMKRKVDADVLLLNVYHDVVGLHDTITPYVGVGFGAAKLKEKVTNFVGIKANVPVSTNLAYKIILGSTFDINDKAKLDVSYNYHNYGITKSKIIEKQEYGKTTYKGHNVNVGFRFHL